MKPPVEMPTAVPHELSVARPLAPVPAGPFHSDAAFGDPGLFQVSHVIDVAVSCARMLPSDEPWPSNAADANRCTKSPTPGIVRRATPSDRPPANTAFVAPPAFARCGLAPLAVHVAVARSGPLLE